MLKHTGEIIRRSGTPFNLRATDKDKAHDAMLKTDYKQVGGLFGKKAGIWSFLWGTKK